jgi:peptide/nickel transport system substrate-binding protein
MRPSSDVTTSDFFHLIGAQILKINKRFAGGVVITATVIASLVATALPSSAANSSPKGDLVLVRNQDFSTFDPDLAQNDSIFVQEQIFEPLFMINLDGKDVRPWLAKSATVSKDKLTWTIKLRTDVKFSDGSPLTAADVKFSLDRATKGDGWGFLNTAIASVTATTPDTVTIKTNAPWAPLLSDLASFSNAILPNNFGGKTADVFLKAPIGTGPFTLDHWTPGVEIKMNANKSYWQPGKPYLNSVTWKYVVDDNTRDLQLKSGQADINEFPPSTSVAALKTAAGIEVTAFPAAASEYIAFNHKVPALSDVHVRRAVSYALDREAIIKVVLAGLGTVSNSILAPNVGFYDPKTPGIQYDLAAAAKELSLSKYKKGLTLEYLATAGSVQDNAMSSILQASLKKIGVTLNIKTQEPKVKRSTQKSMNYQLTSTGWTMDISDPDELMTFALNPKEGGTNSFYTGYNNKVVINAVKRGQTTVNTKVRQRNYSIAQTQVAKDAMMMFVYNAPYIYAWSSKVTGFYVAPTLQYHMEDVKKN